MSYGGGITSKCNHERYIINQAMLHGYANRSVVQTGGRYDRNRKPNRCANRQRGTVG